MSAERLCAALDGGGAQLDDDPAAQLASAGAGVAIAWLGDEAFLRIGGQDRASFLHRILTAELATLAPGHGRRSLLLDNRGRVLADIDVWGGADAWFAGLDRSVRDETAATLERFILRAEVTVERVERTALALTGPGAPALLERAGLQVPAEPYEAHDGVIASAPILLVRSARVPWGFEMIVEGPPRAVVEDLLGIDPGLGLLGPVAQEALRIEAGVPRTGHELTGAEFPQEAGLEAAISFDKGCYLGQETVARIHYRGHVNRVLCGLALDGPVQAPVALRADGREVGKITSASGAEGYRALGYVRREHAEPDSRLAVEGADTIATVRAVHAGTGSAA